MIRRSLRAVTAGLGIAILATAMGCGGSNFGVVPAGGSVKYSDGTIPKGADIAIVTFQPDTATQNSKAATGDITEDGTFRLTTIEPHDGALPGKYRVTVNIMTGYPDGKQAVAKDYLAVDTTPLTATVEPSGANNFELTIEKPAQ